MNASKLLNGINQQLALWLDRLLPSDTQRVQVGVWGLVLLAALYAAWELFRRRRRRVRDSASLIALPGGLFPAGRRYDINGQEFVIGRREDADVCIPDQEVALAHAAISPAEVGYRLKDLGSREGLLLNGRRLSRTAPLRDGDLLEIGENQFRFRQVRPGGWKPEVWIWFLLAYTTGLFFFIQWAAWNVAGSTRPPVATLYTWCGALAAEVWVASLLIRWRKGTLDPLLAPAAMLLLALGLLVVLRTQPQLYTRQTSAAAAGIVLLALAAVVPLAVLARYRYLCLSAGLALLLATLLFGHRIGDQQLAVSLFGLHFQPAEPAKLLLAVFLAALLSERQELVARTGRGWGLTRSDVRYLGPLVVAWGLALALLIVQRDLGTALLFFGLFVAFVGMASGRAIFVLLSLAAFGFGAVLASAAFDRVRERVSLWLNPWQDPQGLGYQLSQGLFALAAGGIRGVGLGNGFPKLVPAAHTDLPMAIIGEELGLIGTLGVLALLAVILVRGYRAALRSEDDFVGLLAAGLTTVLALQAIVIVGGLVRLLPLTGVTLPFISFGGTSLVVNLTLIGMILGAETPAPQPFLRPEAHASRFSWKRRLGWVMGLTVVGFAAIGVFLWWWEVREARELTANPYNPRLGMIAPYLHRGKILDLQGRVVADSVRKQGVYRRLLPQGSLVSALVGYTSRRHGRTGVEDAANMELLGSNDIQSISDALERARLGLPGDNVRLTVDLKLQQAAAAALGDRRGSIVAIDPRTGSVRAMVSNPRFLVNDVDQNWKRLATDRRQPLLFRATHGVYAPGSSFKPVTASTALDAGIVTPTTPFYCSGTGSIRGYTWHCFHGEAHGHVTVAQALQHSCNVTFGTIGHRLGKERLEAGAHRFGIGEAAPMEISTGPGLLDPYHEPWVSVPIQIGFGQGPLAVTPLQMALVASAIANGGVLMKPHLIADYEFPNGGIYYRPKPEVWKRACSANAAGEVKEMMASVVEAGTGTAAQLPGIHVAGKTGTAENPHGKTHAWFICMAPSDKPQIAMAVLVEEGGVGGQVAAPIARQVLASYFGVKEEQTKLRP